MQTEKKRLKTSKKTLWTIILIISLLVFLVSATQLIITFFPRSEDYSDYKSSFTSQTDSVPEPELPDNPINFAAIRADSPDVCAWIKVDGTNIDYPILRSGDDKPEDFYLDHDISGKKKRAGSIYIQRLNSADFTDPNTLIYGHNMLNGTMFASLKKFRNTKFFNENRTMTVYTPGHILKYEIFSAFVYDNRHILNSFDFSSETAYADFLNDCLNPTSLVRNMLPNADVTTEDRIITLSTCTNVDTERYLLVGVLTEDTLTK